MPPSRVPPKTQSKAHNPTRKCRLIGRLPLTRINLIPTQPAVANVSSMFARLSRRHLTVAGTDGSETGGIANKRHRRPCPVRWSGCSRGSWAVRTTARGQGDDLADGGRLRAWESRSSRSRAAACRGAGRAARSVTTASRAGQFPDSTAPEAIALTSWAWSRSFWSA
jgi:hypothetical protein